MKRFILLALLLNAFLIAGLVWRGLEVEAQLATLNGDTDGDGHRTLQDAIYYLQWLVLGGPEPVAIAGSSDLEERVAELEMQVAAFPNVAAIANELAANHASTLQGPPGPQGLPGAGGNPLDAALGQLSLLIDEAEPANTFPSEALAVIESRRGKQTTFQLSIGEELFDNVVGFSGEEAISSPYIYHVAFLDPSPNLAVDLFIGLPARLVFQRGTGEGTASTSIHGVIRAASLASWDGSDAIYTVRMEPAVTQLSREFGSRIFQQRAVPDIFEQIMGDNGLSAYSLNIQGNHPSREYVAQYNETEFDFVQRLLQDDGFFFFTHSGGETMVLGDATTAYSNTGPRVSYVGSGAMPVEGQELITALQRQFRATTDSVFLRDTTSRLRLST